MSVTNTVARKSVATRGGDAGETSLLNGMRVRKDHPRIEAVGELDELSSCLGLARAEGPCRESDAVLCQIQNDLILIAAEIVAPGHLRLERHRIERAHIEFLDREIDRLEFALVPLRRFVLPGGTKSAAAIHLARSVCRRAERRLVALDTADGGVSRTVLTYMNRLGDLLFLLARNENARGDAEEFADA